MVRKLGVPAVRIQLTTEDANAAQKVLEQEIRTFYYGEVVSPESGTFTRGHFRRKTE